MTFITLPERSYGVVPIAKTSSGYEFLLIQQTQGHWTFPKGHRNWGETPFQTAKRELEEETGITEIDIDQNTVFETVYIHTKGWFKRKKRVYFYPGYLQKREIIMQEAEIIDYTWASYEDAKKLLKYPDMEHMLDRLYGYLSTDAPKT